MSVLIKGMEMPKDKPLRIVLNPNGQLFVDHRTWYTEYEAVEIPPHGRLIDADCCNDYFYEHMSDDMMIAAMNAINEMPTIIESEKT